MEFRLLSKYDDLFTDVLLDALHLWFPTIKMNADHRHPRVPCARVLEIIQKNLLATERINDAVRELLDIDYFKHYLSTKTIKQQQEFVQHMKRYLCMYLPNAGFEIGETRRYSNGRHAEACILATKDWHVGDEMRLCTGMIACLDPSADAELKQDDRDFSVMWSSRKGCSCLFLGPARFVNHDCNSNSKFIALGQNSITFKVIREIKCGEELTAFYGKHYFGENNCECRCVTCEGRSEGYFATPNSKDQLPQAEQNDTSGNRRSVRKRKPTVYEDYVAHPCRKTTRRPPQPCPDALDSLLDAKIHTLGSTPTSSTPSTPSETSSSSSSLSSSSSSLSLASHSSTKSLSLTTTTNNNNNNNNNKDTPEERSNVMSIGFICQPTPAPETGSSSASPGESTNASSPLGLLCDAVMDAEYLKVKGSSLQTTKEDSIEPDDCSDTKADSAIGLSPRTSAKDDDYIKLFKQEDGGRENDDGYDGDKESGTNHKINNKLNNKSSNWPRRIKEEDEDEDEDEDDEDDDEVKEEDNDWTFMDELLEGVSDLSSCSDDSFSSFSSSDNDDDDNDDEDDEDGEDEEDEEGNPKVKAVKAPKTRISAAAAAADLSCTACQRPIREERAARANAADLSVASTLATWTWSPSEAFVDWGPERCARCERHFIIFKQEWPSRKAKKPRVKKPKKKDKKPKKLEVAKSNSFIHQNQYSSLPHSSPTSTSTSNVASIHPHLPPPAAVAAPVAITVIDAELMEDLTFSEHDGLFTPQPLTPSSDVFSDIDFS